MLLLVFVVHSSSSSSSSNCLYSCYCTTTRGASGCFLVVDQFGRASIGSSLQRHERFHPWIRFCASERCSEAKMAPTRRIGAWILLVAAYASNTFVANAAENEGCSCTYYSNNDSTSSYFIYNIPAILRSTEPVV